jgi:hypothetical protein
MRLNYYGYLVAALAAGGALGCGSTPAAPAAPTIVVTAAVAPPVVTAPTPQSPVNNERVTGLTTTLTASAATVNVATLVLQYRFQVFGDGDALVFDSGLVAAPSWTTPRTLTPNKRYTWKARAEAEGWMGPWSAVASFTTPDPPPAFASPIGDWQSCASRPNKDALVACVHAAVKPVDSVGTFEVVKRVAWLLRGEGAGLLIKDGGENVILWQGYSFSASRICFSDGHIYKLFVDVGPGGLNAPAISDSGFVDRALYVPAIDPSKP